MNRRSHRRQNTPLILADGSMLQVICTDNSINNHNPPEINSNTNNITREISSKDFPPLFGLEGLNSLSIEDHRPPSFNLLDETATKTEEKTLPQGQQHRMHGRTTVPPRNIPRGPATRPTTATMKRRPGTLSHRNRAVSVALDEASLAKLRGEKEEFLSWISQASQR